MAKFDAMDVLYILALAMVLLLYVYELCCCCHKRLVAAGQRGQGQSTAAAEAVVPPLTTIQLPGFPYEAEAGRASKTLCAICLDELRQGQICSQVPPCRHVFHGDCLHAWARSKGTCPLCRAMIVQGSDEVALADDMV